MNELLARLHVPEWVPSLLALVSLPPFWLLMCGLGMWMFFRGRSSQIAPLEFIRYPVSHLGKDMRLPQPPPVRRSRPSHDGPVWLAAFLLLMGLSLAVVAADFLLRAKGSPLPHPIEERILRVATRGAVTALPRPYLALPVYAILGYLALEIIHAVLLAALAPGHPKPARLTHWLFRACGFAERQRLAFPAWHLGILRFVVAVLLLADVAVVFLGQDTWLGTLAAAHFLPVVLARFFDARSLQELDISIEFPRAAQSRTLDEVVAELARDGWVLADATARKAMEWRVAISDPGSSHAAELSPRLREALQALARSESWYLHQERAWVAFEKRENPLLSLPAGAGRTTWLLLAALATAVERMQTVCLVSTGDLNALEARLRSACNAMSLAWSVRILNLNHCPHPLAALTTFPQILLGSPEQVHDLLTQRVPEDLGLLAFDDLDLFSPQDMQRCGLMCEKTDCRIALACSPLVAEQRQSLEILTARSLTLIDEDTAPCGEVSVVMVAPPSAERLRAVLDRPADEFTQCEWIIDQLRAAGFPPHLAWPMDLTQHLRETGFVNAAHTETSTSLFLFTGHQVPDALGALRHAGIHAATRHVSFWVVNPHVANTGLVQQLQRIHHALETAKAMPPRFDWARTWIPRWGTLSEFALQPLPCSTPRPVFLTPLQTMRVEAQPGPATATLEAGRRPVHLRTVCAQVAVQCHGHQEWSLESGIPLRRMASAPQPESTILTHALHLWIPLEGETLPESWDATHTRLLASIMTAALRHHLRDTEFTSAVVPFECGRTEGASLMVLDTRFTEPRFQTESLLEILATSRDWAAILFRMNRAGAQAARMADHIVARLQEGLEGGWEDLLAVPHLAEAIAASGQEAGTPGARNALATVARVLHECLDGAVPATHASPDEGAESIPPGTEDFARCLQQLHAWMRGVAPEINA